MLQLGLNLTDGFTGFLREKTFLIMDRDSSFHAAFRGLLEQAGTMLVRTPPSSPNCSAHIERFHGSFKREVAHQMIFLGEAHLRRSINEYLESYHRERNHQGLAGKVIVPGPEIGSSKGKIRRAARRHAQLLLSRSRVMDRILRPHESTALSCFAWLRRNARHVCEGGPRSPFGRYFRMLAAETRRPSFASSA